MAIRRFILIVALVASVGMMRATEAGVGVFSVSATKTVKFANANSVYSENELIQWDNLGKVKDEGWDVLTGDEWTYLLADGRTDAADKKLQDVTIKRLTYGNPTMKVFDICKLFV